MTIKDTYFHYLDHFGTTRTVHELHERPDEPNLIALRHDIDHDLDLALEMAHHEHARGCRATYFLLHTHDYWHDAQLIHKCRQLEAYGHEVALHLNVITLWAQGGCNDVDDALRDALTPLRDAGLAITGTSAHGDRACYERQFINYWIWRELRPDDPRKAEHGKAAEGLHTDDAERRVPYPATHALRRDDGATLGLWGSSMAEHGITYDAMHVPVEHYWTDSGGGWTRSADPLTADLSRGRHQVLMHPAWWRGPTKTIFVLSAARSGSKWLANFVDRATSGRGLHEWTLNHRQDGDTMVPDKRTGDDYISLIEQPPTGIDLLQQAVEHHRSSGRDVLEANVYLEPFLPVLRGCGDDVQFLHLHRDGRDVVRSILNRRWYETPDDRKHRAVPMEAWGRLSQFERACWYWRFVNESIAEHVPDRLSFESMVRDPAYLAEQLARLEIVVHPLLAAEEFTRRINASRTDDYPHWDVWAEPDRRTFAGICGVVQAELGYDAPGGTGEATWRAPEGAALESRDRFMVLDLDFADQGLPPVTTRHVQVAQGRGGALLSTINPDPSAHLVLADGVWAEVARDACMAAERSCYYVCRVSYHAPEAFIARLFMLWYGADGTLIEPARVATLRGADAFVESSFAAPRGASHFAPALHLGGQSPDHVLELRSLQIESVELDERYRACPPASTKPRAPGLL